LANIFKDSYELKCIIVAFKILKWELKKQIHKLIIVPQKKIVIHL